MTTTTFRPAARTAESGVGRLQHTQGHGCRLIRPGKQNKLRQTPQVTATSQEDAKTLEQELLSKSQSGSQLGSYSIGTNALMVGVTESTRCWWRSKCFRFNNGKWTMQLATWNSLCKGQVGAETSLLWGQQHMKGTSI